MSRESARQDYTAEDRRGFPELVRAKERLAANDGPGAESILADLVKRDGAPLGAHMLYARVLFRRKKTGAALAAAYAIEKGFPDNWRASAQLGQTLLLLGRAEEAQKHLLEACKKFPEESALVALQVEAQLLAGDPDGALDAIRARDKETEDERLLALRIVTLDAAGKKGQIKKVLLKSEKQPDGLDALYRNVVVNLGKRGKSEDAVTLAERAHARFPNSHALRLLCAEQLLQADRIQDAIRVAESDPADGDVPAEVVLRLLKIRSRFADVKGYGQGNSRT